MDVLGWVRKFLDWERRVFLGEEEWEFPTTRDMSGLAQLLDQRLKKGPTRGNRTVWYGPWRLLTVSIALPDRIVVFGDGSIFTRLFATRYFDGRLSVTPAGRSILGRVRPPRLIGAFLLLCVNFLMLWFLIAVAMFFQDVISCVTGVDYGCDTLANASTVVGLGALVVLLMLALIRYVFGGAIFTLWRTRALLIELAGHGAPV